MNEIIKIDKDNKVSGRELHEFLEVSEKFTDWIKRMIEYGFTAGTDFDSFSEKSDKPSGGRPPVDYRMTIDMAKEICMIQRTERGKQARQYFIECEKRLNTMGLPKLSKELQAIFAIDQKQVQVEEDVKVLKSDFETFRNDVPLFSVECKDLQYAVHKIGINCLGGKMAKAYRDASLRGRVYADIHHQLHREFGVLRYEAIKRAQYYRAKEVIFHYKLPLALEEEVSKMNREDN
jgi:anti-repressor protein